MYWGNTWPLEVVAWWFWKSNVVCEIMARIDGLWKIAFLGVIRRVVVLGKIPTVVCIGELHLMLQIVVVTRLFLCVDYMWWPVVGGASRHLWQQRSINGIIKGCRIKMRSEQYMKVRFKSWDSNKGHGFEVVIVF